MLQIGIFLSVHRFSLFMLNMLIKVVEFLSGGQGDRLKEGVADRNPLL